LVEKYQPGLIVERPNSEKELRGASILVIGTNFIKL
jgi:hypothetical protein